jgi:hypothetical protein
MARYPGTLICGSTPEIAYSATKADLDLDAFRLSLPKEV